jgi:hypothetical protein
MTTARTTVMMARTTAMMAATAMAVARLVGRSVARSEAWLAARSVPWLEGVFFAWHLHTVGIVETCFGNTRCVWAGGTERKVVVKKIHT